MAAGGEEEAYGQGQGEGQQQQFSYTPTPQSRRPTSSIRMAAQMTGLGGTFTDGGIARTMSQHLNRLSMSSPKPDGQRLNQVHQGHHQFQQWPAPTPYSPTTPRLPIEPQLPTHQAINPWTGRPGFSPTAPWLPPEAPYDPRTGTRLGTRPSTILVPTPTTAPQLSLPPYQDVAPLAQRYAHFLSAQDSDLAHSHIPTNHPELIELGHLMNQRIKERYENEPTYIPPLSPKNHPWHPYWTPDDEMAEWFLDAHYERQSDRRASEVDNRDGGWARNQTVHGAREWLAAGEEHGGGDEDGDRDVDME